MSNTFTKPPDDEVETVLLDAELFIKYGAPERAIKSLLTAIERYARSIPLRERLRELAVSGGYREEAARQALALAGLYLVHEDLQKAQERLLEAKDLDPRISIASGLEAIHRARRPNLKSNTGPLTAPSIDQSSITLAGDLSAISIFDALQVVENARLTGALNIKGGERNGRIFFNEGRIVGAEAGFAVGDDAFRNIIEVAIRGSFDFERQTREYPVTIEAASNTNLILDSLRQLDEEKKQ